MAAPLVDAGIAALTDTATSALSFVSDFAGDAKGVLSGIDDTVSSWAGNASTKLSDLSEKAWFQKTAGGAAGGFLSSSVSSASALIAGKESWGEALTNVATGTIFGGVTGVFGGFFSDAADGISGWQGLALKGLLGSGSSVVSNVVTQTVDAEAFGTKFSATDVLQAGLFGFGLSTVAASLERGADEGIGSTVLASSIEGLAHGALDAFSPLVSAVTLGYVENQLQS